MGTGNMEVIFREEARSRGLKFFFTNIPCKRAHLSERYTISGLCVACVKWHDQRPERKEQSRIRNRERYRNNPEVRERAKITGKSFKGTPKNLATRRRWGKTEKARAYARAFSKTEKARATRSKRHAERTRDDVQYRLKHTIRNRIRRAFEENYQTGDALRLLGCTVDFLKAHLERQFTAGMTWKNMGKTAGKWNIDHILPLSSFDLSDPAQAAEACNYKNLQPLWHEDNMRKKAKHPVSFALENGRLL